MTLQQLLVLASHMNRGTDPNAPLGNFQNPFDLGLSAMPTAPPPRAAPASPAPPAVPAPPSESLPLPGSAPTLKDSIVNGGGSTDSFAGNNFAEISPEFAAVTQGPSLSDLALSNQQSPGFTASMPGTPGFGANALGHALTMGLSSIPYAGPFLGLAGRMIGLPSWIAQQVTPNVPLIPDFLLNDPFSLNPTLSLEIEPYDPAFTDFESLSSAPDEPGNEGAEGGEGEGDGDGGDD